MTSLDPPIDVLLQDYFHHAREQANGIALTRLDIVERELREYLEREGHRVLTTGGLAILDAERQFDPHGAFARCMHAGDLVFVLPGYLAGSAGDHLLRRARAKHVEALTARILRYRLVDRSDYSCPLIDLRVALDRSRDDVVRMRREKQLADERGRSTR